MKVGRSFGISLGGMHRPTIGRWLLLSAVLAVVGIFIAASALAESVAELTQLVAELAEKQKNYEISGDSQYLMGQFGSAAGIAANQAKGLFIEFASNTIAAGLPDQLRSMWTDSKRAKNVVEKVGVAYPETPDFGRLAYCDQAKASAKQIAEIEQKIGDLNSLARDAQTFKRDLSGLNNLSEALGRVYERLIGLDAALEEASYGAFTEKWMFFREEWMAGSEGAPNAGFYNYETTNNWNDVERQANAKVMTLRSILDTRRAFDQHFYAAAAYKCTDDAALAAALATFDAPLPAVVAPGNDGVLDSCATAANRALSTASICLQQPTSSMCATFMKTARCDSMAASQCGGCPCSSQLQSAATQARQSAAAVCAQ
jgi:hypothetical protein